MKHSAPLTDDIAIAAIKPGDVVHVLARVVEVFADNLSVDVIGTGARFRVHPRKSLVAAVEPAAPGADIIEALCGAHGRVIADEMLRSRRPGPRAVAG